MAHHAFVAVHLFAASRTNNGQRPSGRRKGYAANDPKICREAGLLHCEAFHRLCPGQEGAHTLWNLDLRVIPRKLIKPKYNNP